MSGNDDLLSGRYRLGELIGVGGMSDVYRAEDTVLGRPVAVKMMRADLARDENFLARFRREAKNSALLNHPSIVSVYDTGETESPMGLVPFIVMELIQGETLRDIVRREGRLDPKKAALIMASVCDALTASHQAGIIHRDIKPANIMLTNTGKVKVMDFGIARALGDSTAMTQTAAVLGTAQYLSPEQARGKTADARSDIYAVGCVLFEAVTGSPPFTGETPLSVAYQHVQDQPPRPSEQINTDPATAQALDAVLLTAMAKDPMERYDSAEEFAEELRRLARGENPLALAHHGAHADDAKTTEFLPASASDAETRVAPAPAPVPVPQPEESAPQSEAPAQVAATEEPEEKKSTGKTIALVAAAMVALGGVGYGAYQIFDSSNKVETVAIPQVAGMNVNEAMQVLEQAGFVVNRVDEPNPDVPRDTVIATEPGVGSGLPEGSRIKLRVSSGPELTNVPDVRDKKAEEARRLLEEAGLVVNPKLREEPHEEIPRGNVIEQSPAAGSQVSKGTRVTLTVSSGLETKTVPDVTGQTLESARTTLESAGFIVEVVEVDSTEKQGTVVEVPQKGTELTVGTTVELHVSRGNQIKMPRVEGQTLADAQKALSDAGFEGHIRTEDVTTLDLAKVDRVEKASPSAGDNVNKDGEVTLRVYRLGVPPPEEPDNPPPGLRLPELLPN